MFSILLHSFLIHFAFICLVFLVGLGVLLISARWFSYKIQAFRVLFFVCLLIGVTSLVVIQSLVLTGGKTVNILFFALIFLLFIQRWRNRSKTAFNAKIIINTREFLAFLPELLIVCTFFSTLGGFSILKTGSFPYSLPYADFNFYAHVSAAFSVTGVENKAHFYNLFKETLPALDLYHYFELWVNSIVQSIFGGKAIVNFFTVTMPFFYVLTAYGFMAIAASGSRSKIQMLQRVMLIFMPIVAGNLFYFFGAAAFFQNMKVSDMLTAFSPNFFILYYRQCVTLPFLLFATLLLLRRSAFFGFPLAFLPVATAAAMPGVYGGMMAIAVIGKRFTGALKQRRLHTIALALIMLAGILVFYRIGRGGTANVATSLPWHHLATSSHYISAFKILYSEAMMLLVFLSWIWVPVAMIYVFDRRLRSKSKGLLFFFGLMSLAGFAGWGLYNHLWDGQQLFTNLAPCLFAVLIAQTLSHGLSESGKPKLAALMLSGAIFTATTITIYAHWQSFKSYEPAYSDEFLTKISKLKPHSPTGVAFESEVTRSKLSFNRKADKVQSKAQYVVFNARLHPPVSLSTTENDVKDLENPEYIELVANNVFYRYQQRLKTEHEYATLKNAQLRFAKEYKIGYFVILPGAIVPPALMSTATEIIRDNKSGESLALVDPIALAQMETEQ